MKTCEDVQNRQPLDTLRWTNTYRYMHRCTAVRIDSRLKLADEPTQCCITPISHVHNRCWKTGMITHACEWMGCDILAVNSQTHTDIHTYTHGWACKQGDWHHLVLSLRPLASECSPGARSGKNRYKEHQWCSSLKHYTHTHTVKMERSFELEPEGEISRHKVYLRRR